MGALEDKVALITGAGTGIGRGIAELFAAEGARVVIAARREGPLREVAAGAPDRISPVRMDLTSQPDRVRALETVIERHGRLDILVNNAADQQWKLFVEQTEDEIDSVIDTNLISTAKLIHRALPLLRETRGNIINISSTAGRYTAVPSQRLTTYSASKAGLNQLTRTLVPELGPMGIRINAVAPGLTHGEVADANLLGDPEAVESVRELIPLGRVGEPIDIARAVLFLASEQASWVTGQVIDSSGGWQVSPG